MVTAKQINSTEFPRAKANNDFLTDRDCVILDGQCDCPRLKGNSLPECKKYPAKHQPINT